MKRTAFLLALVCVLVLPGCGGGITKGAKIDYGTSALYTKADMDAAIDEIKRTFSNMDGCKLYSLSYISDDMCSAENVAWMNELEAANDAEETFTQCIAFGSSFRSPITGGGAWNANREYNWQWWLARSDGGQWKLMTWGY